MAGATTRSSSTATASSWVKSMPRWPACLASTRPPPALRRRWRPGAHDRLRLLPETLAPGVIGPLPEQLHNWKQALGERLPHYMVPSELVACGLFPTNVSDKVDRKRTGIPIPGNAHETTKEQP